MQRLQSRVTGLLTRRTAIVALALLTVGGTAAALLAAEPLRPKSRRPAAASAATSPPSIIVDAATARAMEARGEIRPIGRDGSGQPVYALVINGGATVVLIGTAINATPQPSPAPAPSPGGPPSNGDLWLPVLPLPDWTREEGMCQRGKKTVKYERWVRVKTQTKPPRYAWVKETVTWTLNCDTPVPPSPGPTGVDGNTPYKEGEAWPRNMPVVLPNDNGGSQKELILPPPAAPQQTD